MNKYFRTFSALLCAIVILAVLTAECSEDPVLSLFLRIFAFVYGLALLAGLVSGLVHGLAFRSWRVLQNACCLFIGNFCLDRKRSFLFQLWQGVSRFTWELPQSCLGHAYAQLRNAAGCVSRVDFMGGATFCTTSYATHRKGISLGHEITCWIKDHLDGVAIQRILDDPLYMHEYGHLLDSRIFGLFYLPAVGLPSLLRAQWTELRANRYAAWFFKKYYGVDWQIYRARFPLCRQ
jgi:hypothetical protein